MRILFYLCFTFWIISISVNLISVAEIDVSEKLPFIWFLHIGIFIVLIPTFFYLKNNPLEYEDEDNDSSIFNNGIKLEPYFINSPKWLNIIIICGFIYAFISFFSGMDSYIGAPEIKNGKFILQDHGRFIKEITQVEFHKYKAQELKGFSGIWIAFYGLAFLLLNQIVNYNEIEKKKKKPKLENSILKIRFCYQKCEKRKCGN